MQDYNTCLPTIKLPEYGRNVQDLVERCLAIDDRAKRNRCARRIVGIMANLYPDAKQMADYETILWNHLAIISDFRLDIDYPCEIIQQSSLATRPEHLGYKQDTIRYRMYGKRVEELIAKIDTLDDTAQRIRLFELCANHMKRCFHQTNKAAEEDNDKIIQDLLDYTGGRYKDEIYKVFLYSAKELLVNEQYDPAKLTPAKKKKKKKKK